MKKLALTASFVAVTIVAGVPALAERKGHHDDECAWGRVADGKGNLIRCISKNEAAWLMVKTAPPKEEQTRTAAANGRDGGAAPDGKNPPDGAAAAPKIELAIGPVKVDEGKLPKALALLSGPKKRYMKCVVDNGGMFRKHGEVHVRFLVRQRGRAEGVHVAKRRSVSRAAGKCIADVVDRRRVGKPTAEMVGATLVLRFAEIDD